jgi:hypothetical protein
VLEGQEELAHKPLRHTYPHLKIEPELTRKLLEQVKEAVSEKGGVLFN